jgi:hypothetical protein
MSHIAKSRFLLHLFQIAIHETLIWAVINGPGMILTQQLRLSRDITYCKIGVLEALVSLPLQVAILEDTSHNQRSRFILDSMATIASRYRISRNWIS